MAVFPLQVLYYFENGRNFGHLRTPELCSVEDFSMEALGILSSNLKNSIREGYIPYYSLRHVSHLFNFKPWPLGSLSSTPLAVF